MIFLVLLIKHRLGMKQLKVSPHYPIIKLEGLLYEFCPFQVISITLITRSRYIIYVFWDRL
jgi:hypothetical protein